MTKGPRENDLPKSHLSLRERTSYRGAKGDTYFPRSAQRGVAATRRSGDGAPSYSGAAHQHVVL